jgi:hypothetical protein
LVFWAGARLFISGIEILYQGKIFISYVLQCPKDSPPCFRCHQAGQSLGQDGAHYPSWDQNNSSFIFVDIVSISGRFLLKKEF